MVPEITIAGDSNRALVKVQFVLQTKTKYAPSIGPRTHSNARKTDSGDGLGVKGASELESAFEQAV